MRGAARQGAAGQMQARTGRADAGREPAGQKKWEVQRGLAMHTGWYTVRQCSAPGRRTAHRATARWDRDDTAGTENRGLGGRRNTTGMLVALQGQAQAQLQAQVQVQVQAHGRAQGQAHGKA